MAYVEETQDVDAPASPDTAYTLAVGVGFKGVFIGNADRDWVRVELLAGKTYEISLAGADDNSQADTVLRVFNSQGEQVAINDDVDFAAGRLDSMLTFSPQADGAYYLSAGAYSGNPSQDHSGNYLLSVVDPETDSVARVELQGGAGNDVFRGGPDADELSGGDGDDMLYGQGGADFLTGDTGNDVLDGGAGPDLLLGDKAPPLFPGSLILADMVRDIGAGDTGVTREFSTVVDGSSDDGLDTTAGVDNDMVTVTDLSPATPALTRDDVLTYLADQLAAGDDTLRGGPGNDWLEGGAGDDELLGGDDDDLLFGDSSLVFIPGLLATAILAGDDVFVDDADMVSSVGDDPEQDIGMVLRPDNDDPGEAFNHVLMLLLINELTPGDDRLDGGGGNDHLDGGGGNDELIGGPGMDGLEGGAGNDVLDAGPGNDQLYGGDGADWLRGGTGSDWLAGGPGNDVLEGGEGDDYLMGDIVSSLFLSGVPEDSIVVVDDGNAPVDTVQDDAGSESESDDADDASIAGYDPSGPSLVTGFLIGNDDELYGGPGADLIDGGGGNDRLSGGEGADIFVFAHWGGNDLVTDFLAAEDKIDLSAFADIHSVDDLATRQQENDLVIDLSAQGGGEITLQNVNGADLTDAQFIFFTGEYYAAVA